MGCDFSALLRYAGPTPEIIRAIRRLEEQKDYHSLQSVIDYGVNQEFAFAERDSESDLPAWRGYPDWDKILSDRPELPSLGAELELPSGFMLMFGSDAIWISHYVRWMFFLSDTTWQELLLNAIRHFVELFDASDCIIARDEHPAIIAFRGGASFCRALEASSDEEGAVSSLGDLYIDKGVAEEIGFEDVDGQFCDVPVWDSRGYWRLPE